MTQLGSCSEASIEADEPLAGTAPQASRWILVEYAGTWAPQILESEHLLPSIRSTLQAWSDSNDGCRVQFIRQPGSSALHPTVFMGSSSQDGAWLLQFELASYNELLAIDLHRVFEDGSHPNAIKAKESLHLVCVHGKRDRCCALHGRAVYRAMTRSVGKRVWQTSHLGGHRFAAVTLALPQGVCYGRVRPEDAEALTQAHADGGLYRIDKMRGRCSFSAPVQAAEVFFRKKHEVQVDAALGYEGLEAASDDSWVVRFSYSGETREVSVERRQESEVRAKSCGGEAESCFRFVEL